eukprot:GHUV01019497.1.p2 GENE.GHUV01019497.1~~GHUV01019497.1.p2  ORF type:complete len:105 (-),score=3.37 GHUV01019497.1:525-839(-)
MVTSHAASMQEYFIRYNPRALHCPSMASSLAQLRTLVLRSPPRSGSLHGELPQYGKYHCRLDTSAGFCGRMPWQTARGPGCTADMPPCNKLERHFCSCRRHTSS